VVNLIILIFLLLVNFRKSKISNFDIGITKIDAGYFKEEAIT